MCIKKLTDNKKKKHVEFLVLFIAKSLGHEEGNGTTILKQWLRQQSTNTSTTFDNFQP